MKLFPFNTQIYPPIPVGQNLITIANSEFPASTGVGNSFSTSALQITGSGYCIEAIYTGGINGQISIGASNDGQNFSVIPASIQTVVSPGPGTTSNFSLHVPVANYFYAQFNFSPSSSLASSGGTIRVVACVKDI